MTKFGVGQPVRRLEDARFLTGTGRYTDDITLPGQAWGHVLRSPLAHARIRSVDAAPARAAPGVLSVITGAEMKAAGVGAIPCREPISNRDGTKRAEPDYPVLCADKVRHVGDGVAFVVAETLDEAKDAADLVRVDYEPLDAVAEATKAVEPGAPLVHDDVPGNLVFDWAFGDAAAVEAAFAGAAHVTRIDLVNNRVVAASMEPRGVIADHDGASGRTTLYTGNQGGWPLQEILAGPVLGVGTDTVRVVTPDVGGGFGMKLSLYPEHALCAWASRRLGRPVKWIGERTDAFISDTHGRDHVTRAELAFDKDLRIVALSADTVANLGAYLSAYAPFVPTGAALKVLPGVYDVKRLHYRVRGVLTHTVPVDAYRGAGRPESIYVIERLMDRAARQLGEDPAELRRRNFIPADAMPFTSAAGETYDSGEFERIMDTALERADRAGFEARRVQARGRGVRRGLGFCCYVESTMGDISEGAAIRFTEDGVVEVRVGTQSTGQGHETAYAQVLHEALGVPFARIRIIQGDTDAIPAGGGTGGSRSLTAEGWAIGEAAQAVVGRGKQFAGHVLEAAVADIEFEAGTFRIAGTDRAIGILDLALEARTMADPPDGLDAEARINVKDWTFPNGCHVAEVEIDTDTGAARLVRYTIVDDFGRVVNPLLVEGQVHGGVAQGMGQALLERAVYDGDGQLLSGSFLDYAMPRAADLPSLDFSTVEVPCRNNPMGVKGCGEAGAIASPAAVVNAIVDALAELGIEHVDMPATPETVWRLTHRR